MRSISGYLAPLFLCAAGCDQQQAWAPKAAAAELKTTTPIIQTEIKPGDGVGRAVFNLRNAVNNLYPNKTYPAALKHFMEAGNHFQFAEKNLPKTLSPGVLTIDLQGILKLNNEPITVSNIHLPSAPAARSNKVIVIDAGHGGKDPGANRAGVNEKDITLAVAKQVHKKLQEQGYTVLLTRSGDDTLKLSDRTKFSNDRKASVFVSIHVNSTPDEATSSRGIEILTTDGNRVKKLDEAQKLREEARFIASQRLAQSIDIQLQRQLGEGDRDGKYQHQNLHVCRENGGAAVVAEIGLVNNEGERAKLQTPEHQDSLATAIADGIKEFVK